MGARRGSRRRRRSSGERAGAEGSSETVGAAQIATPAAAEGSAVGRASRIVSSGKSGILLALLLGTLVERLAAGLLPPGAADVYHLLIAIGIAFLVARWYRGFMRETLARARVNRTTRRTRR
jgi:hypothetical protein